MIPTESEKLILVQDVVTTGKEAVILKEHLANIAETIQTLQKQTKQVADAFKAMSEHKLPHNSISTILKQTSDGYSQEQSILQDLSGKIGFDLIKDLNRFQKNWKLVKAATKEYSKATLKHKIKKAVVGNNNNDGQNVHQQHHEEKSKSLLDKQITTTLNELYDIAEDTAFANIFWHTKALEAWSKVYEEMARVNKPSVDGNSDKQRTAEDRSDLEENEAERNE